MRFYRRRLPHWHPPGRALFLTGTYTAACPETGPPPGSPSAGKGFVWMDRYLDQSCMGPTWLLKEDIAQLMVNSFQYGERPCTL